jgi:hypothetical protein
MAVGDSRNTSLMGSMADLKQVESAGRRPSSSRDGLRGSGTLLLVSSLQGPFSDTISRMRSVARAALRREACVGIV